jgi:hypothetical protein
MNTEKLDDLASQAGFDVARLRAPHPGGFPREDMLALESFAELIVIQCAKVARDSVIDHSGHSETNIDPGFLGDKIKEHFGVEE